MAQPTYKEYLSNESTLADYLTYQQRYAVEPRESDKVIISMVVEAVDEARLGGGEPVVVDIGCSTGNLLKHLRATLPDVELQGTDYLEESIAVCRADPALSGIPFEQMNIVDIGVEAVYDVAIVNAVLYLFGDEDFEAALRGLGRAVRPGGRLVVFDFFHPFPQHLEILERSNSNPDGLPLNFRPMRSVERLLHEAGFDECRFAPFEIPLDLQRGATYGDNRSGFEDLNTYTVPAADGRRFLFRGTLFQPWCHLDARRAP